MLHDKRILLGVSGGIAAYKAVELASRLTKAGAEVRAILTQGAQQFLTPLSFRAITNQSVHTSLFTDDDPIPHIRLPEWADLFLVAPATADVLARFATGQGSDLLSASMLSAPCPRLLAPAMNIRMFENAAVQANLATLQERGFHIIPPESGRLACGTVGRGRLPEPAHIVDWVVTLLHSGCDLTGRRMLVTAGACRESLDPMRFLSNHSSGRTGVALAKAAHIRGAEVTLVHAHIDEPPPYYLNVVEATSAAAMHEAVMQRAQAQDVIIMTAAVTDYTFAQTHAAKLKKGDDLDLRMVRTQDILSELGAAKPAGQVLVGFAAESENIIENGRAKLLRKHCDYLAANDLRMAGSADTRIEWLGPDTHETLAGDKLVVANLILDRLAERA